MLAQEKRVVRLTDYLAMTLAVDLEVKPQTKQKQPFFIQVGFRSSSGIMGLDGRNP